ncbi:MAG: MBL fold metallo-hydrolase [Actinobacteria bacterium]|nr:MAG: MBL fold metallo-hydrolase [Actinomycetota bacterium]
MRGKEAAAAVRVGAFEIAVLVDGDGSFATVGQAFPALDAPEEWRLPVNAVLIRGAGTTVLVDTGLGPEPRTFMPGAGARLHAELERAGSSAAEVDLVVHTHLHVDQSAGTEPFPTPATSCRRTTGRTSCRRSRCSGGRTSATAPSLWMTRAWWCSSTASSRSRPGFASCRLRATPPGMRVSSSSHRGVSSPCSGTSSCTSCSLRIRISSTSATMTPSCPLRRASASSGSSPIAARP